MKPHVAIVAAGNMGAGVGGRLVEHGVEVLTLLTGRSAASQKRAKEAGMIGVSAEQLVDVDLLLSIVPPASALSFAEQTAFALKSARRKPVFVDCNAVNPTTVRHIQAVIAATGTDFVDAGIIGFPPRPGSPKTPHIYASGEHAPKLAVLSEYGLDIRVLDAPVGAASALKMAYAGINKGGQALFSAMVLAATRAGSADALREELMESESPILAAMSERIPQMYSKAWRWAPEMLEIAEFVREDPAAHDLFVTFSKFYDRIAQEMTGDQTEIEALKRFFADR
jgi:3-hydroxyisobutyrate dehydrogenase-like beta-hydroxyacid dehydrogenase